MIRSVVFVVFDDFQILDLTGPLAAFEVARHFTGDGYEMRVVSAGGGRVRSSSGLAVESQPFDDCEPFDTLMVIGGAGAEAAGRDPAMRDFIRRRSGDARRTASVCSGAFLLAEAGLLDGRCATTHWRRARSFQVRFPAVKVEADRIYVKDGRVWTSAGITAGIDLALALIEQDHGGEIAALVARELVVYHRRQGGQSQFSTLIQLKPSGDPSAKALAFARERLHEPLGVERLAAAAGLSPRQFARRFLAETGQTPAKAIERLRLEVAKAEVETGGLALDQIARHTGFNDPERMRRAFIRTYGQPPQAMRRVARAG